MTQQRRHMMKIVLMFFSITIIFQLMFAALTTNTVWQNDSSTERLR